MRIPALILATLATLLFAIAPSAATEAAWAKLAGGGHVILMRHAIAPGTGDPANFTIGDCSTQRNLSAEGRSQAQRIGARFAAKGVGIDKVLTSQWCRCIDTARLAFPRMTPVEEPILNSFFADRSTEAVQTEDLKQLIRDVAANGGGNAVFVTHQVNITALTGIVPRQGEAIIVRPDPNGDGVIVAGRIIFN
jgi:phosphohistidine phosphatase SixA